MDIRVGNGARPGLASLCARCQKNRALRSNPKSLRLRRGYAVCELDRWMPLPPLPPKRQRHLASCATAVVDHRIFVIGGCSQEIDPKTGDRVDVSDATTDVWIFDAVAREWSPGPPLPWSHHRIFTCAAVGGRILALGVHELGRSLGTGQQRFSHLCTQTMRWADAEVPDFAGPFRFPGFALGGQLFQPTEAGGGAAAAAAEAMVYDTGAATWRRRALRCDCAGSSSVVAGGSVYSLHSWRWIRQLYVADELRCSAALTSLRRAEEGPLYGVHLAALGSKVVVLGGASRRPGLAVAQSRHVDMWDPATNQWTGLRHMGAMRGTMVASAVLTA